MRFRIIHAIAAAAATAGIAAAMSMPGASVPLASAGKPVKQTSWSPNPLAFGDQATYTVGIRSATLTNNGTKTLRKPVVTLSNVTAGMAVIGDGCAAAVLRPGDSCTVTLIFAPTTTGAQSVVLTATAARESWSATLSGNGIRPPDPVAVVAGSLHTCALLTGGGAACWGANSDGQLGDGTYDTRAVRAGVSGLSSGVAAIAAGTAFSCALVAGGVKCWGANGSGQLGNNSAVASLTPVDVSGLVGGSGVSAIAAGNAHACALLSTGGVMCWGANGYGQLGNSTFTSSTVPVAVAGLSTGVSAIAAGGDNTCALLTTGGVKCWGFNGYGQVGNSKLLNQAVPDDVVGLTSGVAAITVGYSHACAVTTSGGAKCWGNGFANRLGNPEAGAYQSQPIDVSNLASGVAKISIGDAHSCALLTTGGVVCWGTNANGQVGDGTTTDAATPVGVSGLASGVADVSVGGNHTCALLTAGGMVCWGLNTYGALGDNSLETRLVPTALLW